MSKKNRCKCVWKILYQESCEWLIVYSEYRYGIRIDKRNDRPCKRKRSSSLIASPLAFLLFAKCSFQFLNELFFKTDHIMLC